MSLQISLPKGAKVRFIEPEIGLSDPASGARYVARLEQFQVSVYGRGGKPGYHDYIDAGALLEGRGRNEEVAGPDMPYARRDLFISRASVAAEPASSLVLRFPAVEVDDVVQSAQSIPVRLIEKSGVMTCVQ